jgi:hypothetical protein
VLGGVSGHDAAETADENPERVAAALASQPTPWGRIDTRADGAG